MNVGEYREQYAKFSTELTKEFYLYQSGLKPNFEIAAIYEQYQDLYTRSAIDGLISLLENGASQFETERAAAKRLVGFAVEHFLESEVKVLTEQISETEARSTIDWQGRQLTFQEAAVVVSNEKDRSLRQALYRQRSGIIEGSNDLRAERLAKQHEAVRGLAALVPALNSSGSRPEPATARIENENLGPADRLKIPVSGAAEASDESSYTELYRRLLEVDFNQLAASCAEFLQATADPYISRLEQAIGRQLGLTLAEATRADALHFINLSGFESHFPPGRMLEVYSATMGGLGIDTRGQSNVEIDREERPHKNPRAFCAPISIPGNIKLVIRPLGGQADYLALLHEAGHAQHYAWTAESLLPEFKYSGDYALTETYAFLFNHLPSDTGWLRTRLGVETGGEVVRETMLKRLVTIRRYAAKFLFELELHSAADLAASANHYAALQTEATGFKSDEAEYLFDLDDGFYSASYLRAWAFEAKLRDYLKTRFGKAWWNTRKAGSFLKEIWETGERYKADEMASQIGIAPIDFELLIAEFVEGLD